jgi:hypothetical protein
LRQIIDIILKAIVKAARTIKQLFIPILKLNDTTGLGIGEVSLSLNSFLTKASKEYLMGETYCNQVIQSGYVLTFVKSPPKRIIGSMTIGERLTAASVFVNILERR